MTRVFLIVLLLPASAYAWGERGHDAIARVAVRIVAARQGEDTSLSRPLLAREFMLGHLANVPDFVWRNEPAIEAANAHTHYINWDKLGANPTASNVPRTYAAALKIAKERNLEGPKDFGTAPWRIEQLATELTRVFAEVKAAKDPKVFAEKVNQALLIAGIMAHFVGDLAQPYHITSDYDGWQTEQGGIHSYFETELVSALPMSLENDALTVALASNPAAGLIQRTHAQPDPLSLAIIESFEAAQFISEIRALDARYAVIAKSTANPRKPAVRRAPIEIASVFEPIIMERIAAAADLLALIWTNCWIAGGKPDMRAYTSNVYLLAPPFIEPTYVNTP
ncbi:MAG: hypothetical protein H7Z43_07235 [Clostridia bacterium]|nr:hypothetical protein [Deltaproteobacteria bacterium]